MVIFHSDLDNTLIYSYKHDIGEDKTCVEVYQGRDISYMTNLSMKLLKEINSNILVVPTTTRTIEQYRRINLGIEVPKYALVCNGGVLLVDGKEDEAWLKESKSLVSNCEFQLKSAELLLEADENVDFEIRNIKGLFVFTKSKQPEKTIEILKEKLNLKLVEVFTNKAKVYVVPRVLSKGKAVSRFKSKIKADCVIAAGDSEFDISMLNEADIALVPEELENEVFNNKELIHISSKEIFSEGILNYISSKI